MELVAEPVLFVLAPWGPVCLSHLTALAVLLALLAVGLTALACALEMR